MNTGLTKLTRLTRLTRLLVTTLAPIVPAERRDDWRRQWSADLDCQARFLLDDGHSPGAVRRDLLRRGTGAATHAAWLRLRQWRHAMIGQDLKFAWRNIRRRPGFTLAIVLTLGLGVGANATIFSWLDALVLSPLPVVPRSSELVLVRFASPTRTNLSFSYPNYKDVRDAQPEGLRGLAVFNMLSVGFRTTGDPERVWAQPVSGNFFDVLEVPAALGRTLQPRDETAPGAGGDAVAVISDRLWRTRFGASPGAVGQQIVLNGTPFTVVGVTPPAFMGSMAGLAMDVWFPITMHERLTGRDQIRQRGSGFLFALGRRDPRVPDDIATASVRTIASRLAADQKISDTWTLRIAPLREDGAAQVFYPVLSIVMGVVGIVLLIACANVSSLLLARAVARQREITIRTALGASRWHLIRQMLMESLILSTLGGVAGVALASWTTHSLGALLPPLPFPVVIASSINLRVLLFSAAVVSVATVVFGLAPAIQGSRTSLQNTLRAGGTGEQTVRRTRLRRTLVAGQIALATVLLIAASLFVRTLGRAYSADPGFTARTGLLASFDLNSAGVEAARGPEFYTRALERLSALPEVASATITTAMPLAIGGSSDTSPAIEGYTPAPNEDVVVYYGMVAPNFFSTLGIPIVEGRAIDARDRDGQAPVVVINETMARRYWPGRSAVGGRLKTGPEWTTVVGVAKDGKYGALNEAPRAVMYYPIQQVYRAGGTLVVTTNGPAGPAVAAVRRSLAELAPDLALSDVRTIDEHLAGAFAMPRVGAILLGVFGGLALVLASVGLYGVVAFAVSQRTREIGVRLALGAHRGTILRQILGESAWTCGIGLAIGVALALAASPALKSQLVNLSPTDVVSYGATVALLLGVTLVATWLPARRAASVDPVTALRID